MAGLFHSKHQKLILQCYPPGKGIDKKPNPSELSYLLYYASTRRVKLEKVITFLNRKSVSDSNRNKFGNLQVTLAIVSSLIEKCTDNLNVFAPQAISILNSALKDSDISLAKAVLQTYGVLCHNLDGGLFAGDKDFVKSFSDFSKLLIDVGIKNSAKGGPNSSEWKLISLIAARYLSACLGHSPEICKPMLQKTVPLLISTFHENSKENLLKSKLSMDGEGVKLSKIQSAKTMRSQKQINEDLENDNVDNDDLYMESVAGLKSVFNTSLTGQLIEATDIVVNYTYDSSTYSANWSEKFLELCSTWTPVQLRFVLLSTLVSRLKGLNSNTGLQEHYASHILGLVSSNVNMIGLSISDLIQNLLDLKQNLFLGPSRSSDQERTKLASILSNAIINLSTHIYYYDQVPDSVYEIFFKIETALDLGDKNENKGLFEYVENLLYDIDEIFEKLGNNQSESIINRNHIGFEQWQISLPLISQKHSVHIYNLLTLEQVDKIQTIYLNIFKKFLNNELVSNETTPQKELGSQKDLQAFLQPDYDQLISGNSNFLSHHLVYLDKYLNNNDNLNMSVVEQLLDITQRIAQIFGINFLSNFIPFFFHWTSKDLNDDSAKVLTRDNFALNLMFVALNNLDDKYSEQLSGYASNSKFYSQVSSNIQYRIQNNLWVLGIDAPSVDKTSSELYSLTTKDLKQFLSGNEFLSEWLNAEKPLILSILHDDVLKSSSESIDHNGAKNGTAPNGHSNGDSNGHVNGAALVADASTSTSNDFADVRPGLGLGTPADIASIHSGLKNATFNSTLSNQSFDVTNGSIITNERSKAVKVNDLKGMLNNFKSSLKKPSTINTNDNPITPGSVLSKDLVSHDVDSILGGLDEDDEQSMVV